MSEPTKPTPGPWVVGATWPQLTAIYHDSIYIGHAETGEGSDWIGANPIGRERAQANARLMAAAPDLMAACEADEAFMDHWDHCDLCVPSDGNDGEPFCVEGWELYHKANDLRRAALAKARATT